MISNPGSEILYNAATGLERALADVEAEAMLAVRAELITENHDPWKVQEKNIPFLAWGLGVTLWDEDWPVGTKRQWLADQWLWKARVGTVWAIRRALANWDYTLVDVVRPPQGYFASPDFSTEQMRAWLSLMPKLRIRLARSDIGEGGFDQWIADESFIDENFAAEDDGWDLYGRRATLRYPGPGGEEIKLQVAERKLTEREVATVDFEQVRIPGKSSQGLIIDDSFFGEDRFVCAEELAPKNVTYRLDRSRISSTVDYTLSEAVSPGYEPIDVQYARESDIGEAGPFFFADDDGADLAFAEPDYGGFMLADVLYLLDPAVQSMMTEGFSFVGHSRVGMPSYTAEVMVDLHTRDGLEAWIAEESYEGESFANPENTKHLDNAMRAVVAAKAIRDTVLVDFSPLRPLELGDVIYEVTRVGDERRAIL